MSSSTTQNSADTPTLIVIGGASLDILHFAGRTERSAGGAGLYTALAAHRAGAHVTMIGPRPDPVPIELREAVRRLDWRGARVPPEELPTFEIEHGAEGRTKMRNLWWRAEGDLTLEGLPPSLPGGFVYCIALADPSRQVEFLRHFKDQGRRVGAGTFREAFRLDPEAVRQTLSLADVFFCNEVEAIDIFGDLDQVVAESGKLIFVTRGSRGVRVVQGRHATDFTAPAVDELDPTGAGDTFCGTTLAALERGLHPVEAAQRGVAVAAEMVTAIGPTRLLEPAPLTPPPAPASEDPAKIDEVAAILRDAPEVEPFPFVGPRFPRVDHPRALDLFFASTLQQFCFWTDDGNRYLEPMVAELEGEALKGSDFLAACYTRWLEDAPDELSPDGQAQLSLERLADRLSDDHGTCPLPDLETRLQLAREYGRDLVQLGAEPTDLVRTANSSARPLAALLRALDRVGGYKEDPLRKKSALLAIILRQRPEEFLRSAPDDDSPPIVDYHVQRSCLRMGLVRLSDANLATRVARRELLSQNEESAIRAACFDAVAELQVRSGRSMGAVDWFLFQNRSRCPEMSAPRCASCPVDPVCAHLEELFQPVRRTTFY